MTVQEQQPTLADLAAADLAPRPALSDIAVLIPTLGRDTLRACLHSIAIGTAWPARLAVVDQGDNAEVGAWLARLDEAGLRTEHVKCETKGIPVAMNTGLSLVRTDLVAVTHDDCRVFEDWLETLAGHLRANRKAVVTGRVEPGEGGGDGVVLSVRTLPEPRDYTRRPFRRDVLYPNNMGLAVSVFEQVGPFDTHPLFRLAAEDNDWGYRALSAGVPILYRPDAAVYHVDWRDRGQRARTYRVYARGQGAFYAKHLRRGDLLMAVRALMHFASGPWKCLRGVLTGNWDLVTNGRAICAELLPGMVAMWREGGRE